MDKIDELISRAQEAVKTGDMADGLGYHDYSLFTEAEKEKFKEKFEGIGEDTYIITVDGREFVVQLINY